MTASPWEYKAVPAPARARRLRGVRNRAEAFARTFEDVLAEETTDGWEFQRAESLLTEERAGWFGGRRQEWRTLLIFRRARAGAPLGAAEPALTAAAPEATPDPDDAFGRSFARGAPPRPAPTREEPALRLSSSPDPDRDPRLHPDPDAPRLGPADR